MSDQEVEIDDKVLFQFFQKNLEENQIEFLNPLHTLTSSKDYYDYLKKSVSTLIETCERCEKKEINLEESVKIKINTIKEDLWGNLLRSAIIYLRIKDDRDTGDYKEDFGITEIENYFKIFHEFEDLLYGSDKYYRDHSLHVFRVFLLGYFLLKSDKFNINFKHIKIPDWQSTIEEDLISPEEKEAMWCVSSLTHDLGYPIEKISKINGKIREILGYFGSSSVQDVNFSIPTQNQFFNDFVLKFISSRVSVLGKSKNYRLKIQPKYYAKFLTSFQKFSHGISSCILLMKNIVFFLESDYLFEEGFSLTNKETRQFVIRREILRTIASHDCQDIYQFDHPTLSLLLLLCDELQDWERLNREGDDSENKVKITSFSKDLIEFQKEFKLVGNDEIFKRITEKFKNFIRIFRSAVHSDRRKFVFKATYTISKIVFEITFPLGSTPPKIMVDGTEIQPFDFFKAKYLEELEK